MTLIWILFTLCVLTLVYIRLAPSDPARFHILPEVAASKDLPGGVKRRVATGLQGLARLHEAAVASPGTTVLAGSVETGHVTFVSRTKWMGFPDFTSVVQEGNDLVIYARLRFGRKDFGVNKARVDGWLASISE